MNAEYIAATLLLTPERRRVRALLLRIVEDIAAVAALEWSHERTIAESMGLLHWPPMGGPLSPLGKLVAQACRPKSWTTRADAGTQLIDPDGGVAATFDSEALAERVAEMLSDADLAAAKAGR